MKTRKPFKTYFSLIDLNRRHFEWVQAFSTTYQLNRVLKPQIIFRFFVRQAKRSIAIRFIASHMHPQTKKQTFVLLSVIKKISLTSLILTKRNNFTNCTISLSEVNLKMGPRSPTFHPLIKNFMYPSTATRMAIN